MKRKTKNLSLSLPMNVSRILNKSQLNKSMIVENIIIQELSKDVVFKALLIKKGLISNEDETF